MSNFNWKFVDGNNVPLANKKVLFTPVKSPEITGSYLTTADSYQFTTSVAGYIVADIVPNFYKVDISAPLPATSFYISSSNINSSVYSGSIISDNSQYVFFDLINLVKNSSTIKRVTISPVQGVPQYIDDSILVNSAASCSVSGGYAEFQTVFPGTYQVDVYGKIDTTFYISVPEWVSFGETWSPKWNAKDLIVVKPPKSTPVKLNYVDNSYVLTVNSSDARYVKAGGSGSVESASYSDFAAVAGTASYCEGTFTVSDITNVAHIQLTGRGGGGQTVDLSSTPAGFVIDSNTYGQDFHGTFIGDLTGSVYGTASWAINAINGGTTLVTASTYPITSSWAISASHANVVDYFTVDTTLNGGTNEFIKIGTSSKSNVIDSVVVGNNAGNSMANSNQGWYTTLIGANAAQTSADSCVTAVGSNVANSATGISFATLVGYYAGANMSGNNASAVVIGNDAGGHTVDATGAVLIGGLAGWKLKNADGTVAVGNQAGDGEVSASGATLIGSGAIGTDESIAIGHNASASAYQAVLGSTAITSTILRGSVEAVGGITASLLGTSSLALSLVAQTPPTSALVNILSQAVGENTVQISNVTINGDLIYGTSSWSDESTHSAYADYATGADSATNAAFATIAISASWVSASVKITTADTASYITASNIAGNVATASWAINAINGGTTLVTGSTYPITSSWAISASWAPGGTSGTTLATGSTYPITSSWSISSLTSSYSEGTLLVSTGSNVSSIQLQGRGGGGQTVTLQSTPAGFVIDKNTYGQDFNGNFIGNLTGSVSGTSSYAELARTASWSINSIVSNTSLYASRSQWTVSSSFASSSVSASYVDAGNITTGTLAEARLPRTYLRSDAYSYNFPGSFNLRMDNQILTMSFSTASATNDGFLSSTDWSTFNNKTKLTTGSTYPITASNIPFANIDSNIVQIGRSAGTYSTNITASVQIGNHAGEWSSTNLASVQIGNGAGASSSNASWAVQIGNAAGFNSTTASQAVQLGYLAGYNSHNTTNATIIGSSTDGDHDSIAIGYQASASAFQAVLGGTGIISTILRGNVNAAGGVTASLLGTSSWALNTIGGSNSSIFATQSLFATSSLSSSWASSSLSSSYSLTASYALNSGGTSLTTGSTYPITASWANNSITASYTVSASYLSGSITFPTSVQGYFPYWSSSILTNTSPLQYDGTNLIGLITSASVALTASYTLGQASSSISSAYANTSSWALNTVGGSRTSTYSTQSIFATQSLYSTQSIFATSSIQSSYATSSLSSSWASSSISSSYSLTASYAINAGGTTIISGSSYNITASWATNTLTSSCVVTQLAGTSSWHIFESGSDLVFKFF